MSCLEHDVYYRRCTSSYEAGELSQWLFYDDSTINILTLIIILIIIINDLSCKEPKG